MPLEEAVRLLERKGNVVGARHATQRLEALPPADPDAARLSARYFM